MLPDIRRSFRELLVRVWYSEQCIGEIVPGSRPCVWPEAEPAGHVEVIDRVVLVRRIEEAVFARVAALDPRKVVEKTVGVVHERSGTVAAEPDSKAAVEAELRGPDR